MLGHTILAHAISLPIPFLKKDRGYCVSLILLIIGVLVIQWQLCLSTDVIKLSEGSWNELGQLSYLTYYLPDKHIEKLMELKHLTFLTFMTVARQLTSQISHVDDQVVIQW